MLMGVILLVMAAPVFAGEGGADVQKYGPCTTGISNPPVGEQCHLVVTPSGITNVLVHAHPQADDPASGGGAVHEEPVCVDPQQQGGVVTTPSGNTNVHCTGPG
jgi:hypothetical protein